MVWYLGVLTALFAGGLICLVLFAVHLRRKVARKEEALKQALHKREQDMDKLKKAHALLEAAAKVDGFTGVPNRVGFEEALGREWRRGLRNQTELTLILIDIDEFTEYNDAVGPLGGDDLLRRVASALRESLMRPFDVVARFAGAGFACLLPETDRDGGVIMAERLTKAVAELHLVHPASKHGQVVTICQGIATAMPHPDDVTEILLDNAHSALKRAKQNGPGTAWAAPAAPTDPQ